MSLKRFWNFLRTFILTWFFVPTMIILAGVAIMTYLSYMRVTDEVIIGRNRELTSVAAVRLRDELGKFMDLLTTLSRTEAITSGQSQRQQAELDRVRARLVVFDGGVVVLDNFGRVAATEPVHTELIGKDWSGRDYFRQILVNGGVIFSDILPDGLDGSDVIVIAVPVTGPNGEFVGALAGMFRLGNATISSFYASIVRLRISASGDTYLVDSDGRVIYHNDITLTGRSMREDAIVQEVLRGRSAAQRVLNELGAPVVASYAPVPGTSWGLITEENWGVLTASTRQYGQILLVLLGLGMFLPALGVASMIGQRNRDALERERMAQELRVANLIQKTLLPRELPSIPGWEIAAHWQPARAVGGDLYDFIQFPDGAMGLVMADVTDKGIPAALVMASARSVVRGVADRLRSPGLVLERVNNLLCLDIPRNMFVTCLYAELHPDTGRLRYANAGQNLPYRKCADGLVMLDATGMPLGLMSGMFYEENETILEPGEFLLLYSDGLVEAHDPRRKMFGNERVEKLLERAGVESASVTVERLWRALHQFTGQEWEQEDDVTLVLIRRLAPGEETNRSDVDEPALANINGI